MVRDLTDNGYKPLFFGMKNKEDVLTFAFVNRRTNAIAIFESRGEIESDRQCVVTNATNIKWTKN